MQGKIIKGIAGFYYIYAEDDNVYECKAKGIFRKDKFKPLVGDNVEITVLDEEGKEGSVTAILPRKNSLIRPAVANVDQAFVIFAMEDPKPNFLLLDRFLIMMEQQQIPSVICFNKKDLEKKKNWKSCMKPIQDADIRWYYPALCRVTELRKSAGSSTVRPQWWPDPWG